MTDRAAFDAWASQWGGSLGLHHLDVDGLWLAWQEAVRLEREACAKLVEAHRPALGQDPIGFLAERKVMQVCAAAIRARSEL